MSGAEFRSKAAKGFAWNHLYRLADYGLWNLFTMLIARKLGPSGAAPFFFYYSLALPIALLGGLGVDGVMLRYLSKVRAHDGEIDPKDPSTFPISAFLNKLLSFRLFVTIILSLLLCLVLIILPRYSSAAANAFGSLPAFAPFLIIFLWGQALTAFASSALIGLLQVRWVFIASVIARSLLLATGVTLVLLDKLTVDWVVKIQAGSVVFSAILLLGGLWKVIAAINREKALQSQIVVSHKISIGQSLKNFFAKPSTIRLFLATPVMAYGIATWGSDILSNVLGRQPDMLMMGAFFGDHSTQIGYYSAANTLLMVVQYIFLFGFSGALVSIFSALAHEDTTEAVKNQTTGFPRLYRARREIAAFQTVAVLPLCAFAFVFGGRILGFVFGQKYMPAIPIVQCGLIIMAINLAIVGGGVHSTTLVTIGKERLLFKSRLTWGILNLIANFFLIQQFGALGALFGTQLCDLGACTTEGYFSKKAVGGSFYWRTAATVIGVVIVSAAAANFLVESVGNSLGVLLQIAIGAVVTMGLSLLFYIVLRIEAAKQIFLRLQRLYRPKLT